MKPNKKTHRPMVPCPACSGAGWTHLSQEHQWTLDTVRELKEATSTKLLDRCPDKVGLSAICNRLEDLFNWQLLERRRVGRAWVYSVREN